MGVALLILVTLLVIVLTVFNIIYTLNIMFYVDLFRQGMVRVKVRYSLENGEDKILRGWARRVDLNTIVKNPVSQSSSFVKVFIRGQQEVVLAFSTVKKLEVLGESYLSVVFAKRYYL